MSDTIELVPTYGDSMGQTLVYNDDETTQLAVARGELVPPSEWPPVEDPNDTIPTVMMTPTVGDSAGDALLYDATQETMIAYQRGELNTVEGGVYPGDTTTVPGGDTTSAAPGSDTI